MLHTVCVRVNSVVLCKQSSRHTAYIQWYKNVKSVVKHHVDFKQFICTYRRHRFQLLHLTQILLSTYDPLFHEIARFLVCSLHTEIKPGLYTPSCLFSLYKMTCFWVVWLFSNYFVDHRSILS